MLYGLLFVWITYFSWLWGQQFIYLAMDCASSSLLCLCILIYHSYVVVFLLFVLIVSWNISLSCVLHSNIILSCCIKFDLFFILFYFILWIIYISFHYYISSDIWTVCSSVRLSEFLLSSLKLYASLVIDKSVLSGPLPLNITWLVAVTNTFGVATMNGIDPKEWH